MSDRSGKRAPSEAERAPSEGECVAFIVSCFAGLHPAHAQRVLRACRGDVTAAVEHYQSLLCAQDIARSEGRPFAELDGSGLSTAEVARAAASRSAAAEHEHEHDDDDDDNVDEELSLEDERTLDEFIRTHSDRRLGPSPSEAADEMATEESDGRESEGDAPADEPAVDDTTLSQLVEVFPQFAFEHIRSVLVQHHGDFDAAVDELAALDRAADEECAKDAALTSTPVSLAAGASIAAWKKRAPQHSPPPMPTQAGKKARPQIIGRAARLKRLSSMYGSYIGEDMLEEIFTASHERIDETEAALKDLFPDIYERVVSAQERQQSKQQQQAKQQQQQQQQQQKQGKAGKVAKAQAQRGTPRQKGKGARKDPNAPVPGTRIDARGRINVPQTQASAEAPNASIARDQDYIDAQYRRRDECHRCASIAFAEGDHERVRKLLALAQECERRIQAVRENAVGDALLNAPHYARRKHVIDLHGFRPAEALAVLESALLGPTDLAGTTLLVITGRGAHSRRHQPVVRPAVEKWLRDHSFTFRDVNGGSFNVFL